MKARYAKLLCDLQLPISASHEGIMLSWKEDLHELA